MVFHVIALSLAVSMHNEVDLPCHILNHDPSDPNIFRKFYCNLETQYCCDSGCCEKPPSPGYLHGIPTEIWAMLPIAGGFLIGILITCICRICCAKEPTGTTIPSNRQLTQEDCGSPPRRLALDAVPNHNQENSHQWSPPPSYEIAIQIPASQPEDTVPTYEDVTKGTDIPR